MCCCHALLLRYFALAQSRNRLAKTSLTASQVLFPSPPFSGILSLQRETGKDTFVTGEVGHLTQKPLEVACRRHSEESGDSLKTHRMP